MITALQLVIGTEVLALVLSGGTAAMIAAVVQAWRSIREGSRAEDRDAYAEMESARRTEAKRRARAEVERDYWHRRAATLEYSLISSLGTDRLPPKEPWPEAPDLEEPV